MDKLVRWVIILVMMAFLMPICSLAQEIPRVKLEELKKMIDNKADIVIVDTQPKSAYEIVHIQGAINFPWAMEIKGPLNLPRNKLLILYCDCTHEEDSIDMATKLIKKFGYDHSRIKVLEGGLSKWFKLGYPIEKGKGK